MRTGNSCLRVLLFAGPAVLCILTVGLAWALTEIPREATSAFGLPSPKIDTAQQIILAIQMLPSKGDLTNPVNREGAPVKFRVENNQSVSEITTNLQKAGLIINADALRLYLIYSGKDTTLLAGDYSLSPKMSAIEIAGALQDTALQMVLFRILPGWRLEEIAAALPYSGLKITSEELIKEAKAPNPASIPSELANLKSYEGFFFPGEYQFKRDTSAQEIVSAVLKRFSEKVNFDLRQSFTRQGLTLSQAVILASIIQREAMVASEMPMIASVFYNRLNRQMKLDSDPTVQYAIGYNINQKTWWTNPLSLAQLKVDSSYNTYARVGLPPGAISNPSLEALQAVGNPAKSNFFYFRARCDQSGTHNFAATYEEHLKNGCP